MLKSIFVSSLVISQTLAADFEYPEHDQDWAKDTNYCGNDHKYQSPINIQTSTLEKCETTKPLTWSLKNIDTFNVENTGHNLKMIPVLSGIVDNEDSDDNDDEDDSHDDSDDNPEFENLKSGKEFGVLTDIFGTMGEYCLDSFHIHWGGIDSEEYGSEHRIDSQQSAMEMHFVHRACEYDTVSKALDITIDDDEKADPTLAVVSVLFKIGDENSLIKQIIDHPQFNDKLGKHEAQIEIKASMTDVVPMDDGKIDGDYYHYKGSLTTPPCNPVVSWHVLEKKMTVSAEQLKALRETIKNEHNTVGISNFRGTKTNGHKVSKCSASGSDDD